MSDEKRIRDAFKKIRGRLGVLVHPNASETRGRYVHEAREALDVLENEFKAMEDIITMTRKT